MPLLTYNSQFTVGQSRYNDKDFENHYYQILQDNPDIDQDLFYKGIKKYHHSEDIDPSYLPTADQILKLGQQADWEESGVDIGGAASVLGQIIKRLPGRTAASLISAFQGMSGVDVIDPDVFERYQRRSDEESQRFRQEIREKYKGRRILPFVPLKITDLGDLDASAGFSTAAAAAGLSAGAAGSLGGTMVAGPLGGKIAGYAAGMSAAGAAAYNMAGNHFMNEVLTYHNELMNQTEGRNLTDEEQESIRAAAEDAAHQIGLWEAIPEAIGSGLGFKFITTPLSKFFGKNLASRIVQKLGGLYGGEFATETITEMGQGRTRSRAQQIGLLPVPQDGIQDYNFQDWRHWVRSFKEIAPQTFLLTTGMGAGVKVGTVAWNKAIGTEKREADAAANVIEAVKTGELLNDKITDSVFTDFYNKAQDLARRRPDDADLSDAVAKLDDIAIARSERDQTIEDNLEKFEDGDYFNERNNQIILEKIISDQKLPGGLLPPSRRQAVIDQFFGEVAPEEKAPEKTLAERNQEQLEKEYDQFVSEYEKEQRALEMEQRRAQMEEEDNQYFSEMYNRLGVGQVFSEGEYLEGQREMGQGPTEGEASIIVDEDTGQAISEGEYLEGQRKTGQGPKYSTKSGITRRDFLKILGLTTAGAAVSPKQTFKILTENSEGALAAIKSLNREEQVGMFWRLMEDIYELIGDKKITDKEAYELFYRAIPKSESYIKNAILDNLGRNIKKGDFDYLESSLFVDYFSDTDTVGDSAMGRGDNPFISPKNLYNLKRYISAIEALPFKETKDARTIRGDQKVTPEAVPQDVGKRAQDPRIQDIQRDTEARRQADDTALSQEEQKEAHPLPREIVEGNLNAVAPDLQPVFLGYAPPGYSPAGYSFQVTNPESGMYKSSFTIPEDAMWNAVDIADHIDQIEDLYRRHQEKYGKRDRNLEDIQQPRDAETRKQAPAVTVLADTPGPASGITMNDVREVFPGQKIFIAPDNTISVFLTNGNQITIRKVNWIHPDKMVIDTSDLITGSYEDGRIELNRDYADSWTLAHESVHYLVDLGIITPEEFDLLVKAANKRIAAGRMEDNGDNEENVADYLADEKIFPETDEGIKGIVNKIADWIDRLLNYLGRPSARSVVRDFRTGRIYDRKADSQRGNITKYSRRSSIDRKGQQGKGPARREFEALTRTMSSMMPSNVPPLTFLEQVLKSPEWYSHPVLRQLVHHAITRSDLFHEYMSELSAIDDPFDANESVVQVTKELKNKGVSRAKRLKGETSKEYKTLMAMIDHGDTTFQRKQGESRVKALERFVQEWRDRGATDDVIYVWEKHRETYDKALDYLLKPMQEMLDKLKEEAAFKGEDPNEVDMKNVVSVAGKKGKLRTISLKQAIARMNEWRGFYAPRLRDRGKWVVQAAKGQEQFRYHRPTRQSAERLYGRLKEEGYRVKPPEEVERIPEEVYQQLRLISTQTLLEKAAKSAGKGIDSAEIAAKFREDLIQEVADLIRARGFRSSMIRRGKGGVVKGYIEDPLERMVRYSSNLSAGLAKSETAQKMVKSVMDGIDPSKDPRAYAAAKRYIEEQLRNIDNIDRFIGLAKSAASIKYLGLPNLRSPFVNLTAMLTTTPPAIRNYALKRKGGFTRIARALGKAGKDYGKFMVKGRTKGLTLDEQRMLDEAETKGYTAPQHTRDAMGVLQGQFGRAYTAAMQGSMFMFGQTEKWNRGTTMLAAYRLARQDGQKHGEAVDNARDATNKAHGLYGKATLPSWAQGNNPLAKIGQMTYVYQKFAHNWLQMMYDLGLKQKDIKSFLYAVLSPVVLGGFSSIPLKSAFLGIIGVIMSAMGDDRDPEKLVMDGVRETLGDRGERIARYGALGAADIDISGSMSIDYQIPKSMMDLTGAIGGVSRDFADAHHFVRIGELDRAFETMLPVGLGNILRARREAAEGVTTRRGRTLFDERDRPYKPTKTETGLRTAGFRSARVATTQARRYEMKKEKANFKKRRDRIYEMYRNYRANPTPEKRAEIRQKIREYNKKVRASGRRKNIPLISLSSLRQQARRAKRPIKSERF